jgi:hypothetical protein
VKTRGDMAAILLTGGTSTSGGRNAVGDGMAGTVAGPAIEPTIPHDALEWPELGGLGLAPLAYKRFRDACGGKSTPAALYRRYGAGFCHFHG